jgi:crossover junction endodeoxyribonuclease RuvC
MTILGIDPGIATTGYGLIERQNGKMIAKDYGCILTPKEATTSIRLRQLYEHAHQLVEQTAPDIVVIEKLFFNTNVTTAMNVGQARGVVLLAIEQFGLPIAEYTPLQVKMAVCGFGRAKKPQVQQMVASLLRLSAPPKPDDAADALAIALCHTAALPLRQAQTTLQSI